MEKNYYFLVIQLVLYLLCITTSHETVYHCFRLKTIVKYIHMRNTSYNKKSEIIVKYFLISLRSWFFCFLAFFISTTTVRAFIVDLFNFSILQRKTYDLLLS